MIIHRINAFDDDDRVNEHSVKIMSDDIIDDNHDDGDDDTMMMMIMTL